MTNEEEPLMLLKFGKKEHMDSLITKGEVFLNTRRFYSDIEDIEIGDYWEGIDEIRQTSRIALSRPEPEQHTQFGITRDMYRAHPASRERRAPAMQPEAT